MVQVDEAVSSSDGGRWHDTVAKPDFHDAIRILNRYHLSEHIWEVARASGVNDVGAKRWALGNHGLLRESSRLGLLRSSERSRRTGGSAPDHSMLGGGEWLDRSRAAAVGHDRLRRVSPAGAVVGSRTFYRRASGWWAGGLRPACYQRSEVGAVTLTRLIAQRLDRK